MTTPLPIRPENQVDPTPRRVKPFAAMIQEVGDGKAHGVLSDLVQQLVAAVRATGKKGKLTVVLTIEPVGDNLSVTVAPKLDAPNDYDRKGVFFVDKDDNLTRDDPNNKQMPLRSVGQEPTR